ncbi:hypothetical protein [Micromonospora mirobrigensis]|uniref:Uncharacterized protein n=1 Tax=Micromonospora mirobrigensis TaxID=262898 RepID=A0A1C4WR54_9ACTN|nr:hypothetical protein [Micromonospora mirobrigensis]SCE98629.1 hypothetical protein GA0070564_102448 [Micromonospora mirobrigensis]
MATEINYDGLTVGQLYETFTKAGIDRSEASVLVSSWIYENVGSARRVFNYAEPFPAVEPGCAPPAFARTFAHTDWVDGEDVVQAGQTTGELGFNERFHRIEHDLDHLGTDLAKAFSCLAAMRASVRKLLDEIRAELNRLNSSVHDSGAITGGPLTIDTYPNYPLAALDFGRYMGTTMFLDKKVSVWQTKQGTIVLPAVETVGVDAVAGTKLRGAGQISRYLNENVDPRRRFPQQVRIDEFVRVFGEEELADGRNVRDVLKALPADGVYENLDAMVVELGEREAAMVRTTTGAPAAVAAALGVDTALQSVAEGDVATLTAVPTRARAALAKSGVNTIGQLAELPAERVVSIMKENQVGASMGDAAEWTAYAQTLTRLR